MIKVVGFDESIVNRKTCTNCGAIIEFTSSDVEKKTDEKRDGSLKNCNVITCPSCKKYIILTD